jgi:sugar phosphate isomerase/epimerase
MPKFSVSEVTTRDWTFEEDVINYAAAGIEGIGIWRDKLDIYGTERGIKLLAESPLQAANLVDSGYFLHKTRSQTKRAIEDVVEAIELAQRLRTDCLLIVTGDVGSFFRTVDQAKQLVVEALKEVAPVAESAGIRLAIEPIHSRYAGYTFLHNIPDTLAIAEAVGSPNVGLFFDTDHLWESPDLLADIEHAGDRIFGVHINDMPAKPRPGIDRRILGEGVIPLKEILSAIEGTGYSGFYDVEIMSDEVWAMDYHVLLEACKAGFARIWA